MRTPLLLVFAVLVGCSTESNNAANNTQENNDSSRCSESEFPDEMRIKVRKADGKDFIDLTATLTFEDGSVEDWKCSTATRDGILCQATPTLIEIIAKKDNRGEITKVDLSEPKDHAFSGDVEFTYQDAPSGKGCNFPRGVVEIEMTI